MTRTMRTFIYTILPFFLLLYSCEEFQQEEEVVCLPVNMTATVIQGTESTKVIADFHYVPGTS
jgi:hypothetical protein